jgi:DNA-binding HxlR family transcriptional regulator
VRILKEFARIARRWVIVDLRHRYSYHWLRWKAKHLFGQIARLPPRMTRRQLASEVTEAGLVIRKVFSVAPVFSDKWIVVLERKDS